MGAIGQADAHHDDIIEGDVGGGDARGTTDVVQKRRSDDIGIRARPPCLLGGLARAPAG
ncbi:MULTISPECIES: hypothetical protein [Frankia]|uniref:hypothetical protein n=1 Tax=Frankia TaxID=1854 RepID=UPI001362AD97|nr:MULTISPECIES: hypothetical protein [Frankia]